MTIRKFGQYLLLYIAIIQFFELPMSAADITPLSQESAASFKAVTANGTSPMFVRYLAAGDAAHLKRDDEKARQNYIAALSALEQGKGKDVGMFPRLEHRLLTMYPSDWSKSTLPAEQKHKLQKEQVFILGRLVRITTYYQSYLSGGPLVEMAKSSLKKATDDLNATEAVSDTQ